MKGSLQIALSYQAVAILEQIAERGIWGGNAEEVAARLVNEGLEQFIVRPTLGVALEKRAK